MMYLGAAWAMRSLLLLCSLISTSVSISEFSVVPSPPEPLRFFYDSYNASIQENSRPRTYLGSRRLMGVPLDSLPPTAHVRFSIVAGDSDGFFMAETEEIGGVAVLRIRTRTGLTDVLNRERRAEYYLTVAGEVRSHHQLYSSVSVSTTVNIKVLDINDNIPLFYEDLYDVTVAEDSELHTLLVTVSAEDADVGPNGKVYYSLADPLGDYFSVHPTRGVVSLTRPLDSSVRTQHKIVIFAKDRGVKPKPKNQRTSLVSKTTVLIHVRKVNLHSPKLTINHLPSIIEHAHTHIYAIITVKDRDLGRSGKIKSVDIFSGDPNHLFSVLKGAKPDEYNLAVLKLLDRELAPIGYNLTIRATDAGTPPRSTIANIHVNIADINDQAPVFLKEQYEEEVSEEAPPHTSVVRVAASDLDQDNNGKVLFRIVAGNEDNKFTINPQTGLISTTDWLDAESTAYYSLAVAAVDQASNARRKQSSAKVIVRVRDGNDNAPQFQNRKISVTIDENEPASSYVARVSASDEDSGENGFVSYSIANLDQVPFTIDPFDGTIRTSSVLDFEAQRRVYTIKVRASDWGQPLKRENETTVQVTVRDVNDNRPVFVGNVCSGWIDLDSPIGYTLTQFKAIDLDQGDRVFYRIEGSDMKECWALDSSSGFLAVSCKLRERNSKLMKRNIVINVTATDGNHISDPASLSLVLIDKEKDVTHGSQSHARVACEETSIIKKRLDNERSARENTETIENFAMLPLRYGENNHTPEFPPNFPDIIEVLENVEVKSRILKIDAIDHDPGHNGRVVYAIADGDVDSIFKIDTFTGDIYVDSELDRERTNQYILNITAYDLGVPHKMSTKNLTVNILDVNDNAPQFTQLSYSLHLPENTRNGTSVAQITAKDADMGQNGLVTYEIVTKLKEFTLDATTGVLSVTSYLDRETRDQFDLRIRAWDSSLDNPRFTLTRVLIAILDVNDCAPDFGAARELKISVPEDIPLGAVVATLQASDKDKGDGGRVSYSFSSGSNRHFRVDAETGIVRVNRPLDYESQQLYNITVKAEDGGFPSLFSLATLIVQVTNEDENSGPPQLLERLIRASVLENEPPGSLVSKVEAMDPDGGQLSYKIVGGSGKGIFSITNKGEIRTLRRLDRETQKGYWLTVAVTDDGTVPLSDTCHVYVEVGDVNDHLPQTEDPVYRPFLPEDAPIGTTVVVLRATDADLAPSNVTFFVSRSRRRRNGWMLQHPEGEEDAQEVFGVNKETGTVTTTAPLNRERQPEYDLWIGLTDGQRTTVTPIFITVTDVNDNAPSFLEKVYRFSVPERPRSRANKRQPIFRVFARDLDDGRNADIRYSIKTRRGKTRFKIDEATGFIFCSKALSAGQTFDLTVKATDNGFPQMSSTAHVIIRVAEIPQSSNHPPIIDVPPTAHVMETDPVGHVVTFINAFDIDNDTIWYSIEDGNEGNHFSVGLDSGLLILAKALDRESRDSYDLTIAITDGVHTSKAQVVVRVLDFNDHRPSFSRPIYKITVAEDTIVGTTVMTLRCKDRDSLLARSSPSYDLPSSSLFFSVHHTQSIQTPSLFSLDPTTGNIVLAEPLNREVLAWHELTVSCQDRGGIQREDLARVVITVKDVNDHEPIFLESTIEAQVLEGASPGTVIVRVTAVDEDEGENGRISYSIVEGNQGATFAIDPELGHLTLEQPLLYIKAKEYLLLVRAMDHAHKPKAASVPVRITVQSSLDIPPSWKGIHFPRVVELSEWAPPNTVIAMVTAASPSSLHYEIAGGNSPEESFAISPSSGFLSLKTPLDYETKNFFNLTIKATNAVGVSRSTWICVRVLDENDWPPMWETLEYEASVLDTAKVGSPVLRSRYEPHPEPLTIKAVDRDSGRNGRVTYTIVERNKNNLFSIDKFTGALRVSGRLQDIRDSTIEMRVWARDNGEPRRECVVPATIKITVRRENALPLSFEKPLYETTVYLPTVAGVKVTCVFVTNISSSLQNNNYKRGVPDTRELHLPRQPLKYTITGGNSEKHFKVDPTEGCVYVSNHVELAAIYNLTLNASDGQPAPATTSLIIRVSELPKGSLRFTRDLYWANVLENTTSEVKLLAVSVRGLPLQAHVKYSLLNGHDFFEIRPTSGILKTTGKPFDWETQNHFSLIVHAQELERQDSFGHITVNVAVLDVNDNEPVFVGQPYDTLVSTSASRGHVIGKVRAVDADSGAYGDVRYELVRGSGDLFHVDKQSGEISLKQSLTDAHKTLSLTVAAYDGGKQPLSSQAHVLIRVVSAEGPLFDSPFYEATMPENKGVGSAVVRVKARSPSGNDVIYTLLAGNQQGHFDLDYETGLIRIASPLDFEAKSTHNLTVRARDPLSGLHSDAHVSVALLDVNDNPPQFQKVKFTGKVSEVATIGHTILKVQAYDRDTGLGGVIRYACSGDCGNFSIDAETGLVLLNGQLDAEYLTDFTFTVVAEDQGLPPLAAKTTVTIQVLDFNDNAPVWPQDTYFARVSTEAKAGHAITAMAARDPDITNQDGSQLHYHIIGGDLQSLFNMDATLGIVTVTAPHKLLGGSRVNLNISASDGVFVAFTSLRILVLSANDHPPRFPKPSYETSVEENSAPGQLVGAVIATDADGGEHATIHYDILEQEKERKFTIDEEGNIHTEVSLDRESEPFHEILITAQDSGGKSDFAKMRVYISDKNDNSPIFSLPQYQANIPVDTPPDTKILKVSAVDVDEGANSRVGYALYEDDNSDALRLFRLDRELGDLYLTEEVVDKENEVFQFFIRATDGGSPPLHSDVPITIFLISAHERPPFCARRYAQFFLSEDDPIGTVVTSLWLTDQMEFKYSLLSNEDGLVDSFDLSEEGKDLPSLFFGLSGSSQLVVKKPLDQETQRVHKVTVVNQTLTTPPLIDYMTISIVVMDVNDCTPEFSASHYDVIVAENTPVGSVITELSATDKDDGNNGQIQYSLKNTTDTWVKSVLSIDPHSGLITLVAALDREANASLSFVVVATDNGPNPLSSEAEVTLLVRDYNDNPPVFSRDVYVTNVPEDTATGTVVVELSLQDEDSESSPLDFFFLGAEDEGKFLVHTSGQVYVARPLDRETRSHYSLIVTATDGKFSANTTVSINVFDVNDNGPDCKEAAYRRSVSENAPVGSHIVSVSVYDPDEGSNAKSRFLLTGDGVGDFNVDQYTGKVVVARRLDRESQETYNLVVTVEDFEKSEWRCSSSLLISVTDVNDNPPRFVQESFTVFVAEDAAINSVITKIIATDADLGKNRRLRYSLPDSPDGQFAIDANEGIVTLTHSLDREMDDTHSIVVEVRDLGTPSFSSSAVLTVTVTDVNDNPPEFVRTLQQITVAENTPVGTEISRVMATSKDIGINAEIIYSVEHTTEVQYLAVHQKTGVITINALMDFEEVQVVVVTVIATDGGSPPLTATALINVTITDMNDNGPVFTRTLHETTVPENQEIGRSLLQISANDPDSGRNGEVTFLISKGNEEDMFSIKSYSGIISLTGHLDREKVNEYELEVTATDKGSPSNSVSTNVKIRVLDVNDNPPSFLGSNFTAIVQENRPVGYEIFRFVVTDADADPNGHPFTWELLGKSPLAPTSADMPFTLKQGGTLHLATNKLDHRAKKYYDVSVRVWDSGSPPLSADAVVHITVVEESRYPPTLFPLHSFVFSYLIPYPGGIIGKITALDQDPYDTLHYSIISDMKHETPDYFDVDSQDGTLVALSPLDSGNYSVDLNVSDGKYQRQVTALVTVFILTDEMIDSSVIIRIGPLSEEEFLARYRRMFLTVISTEIGVQKDDLIILSLQPTILHSRSSFTNRSRSVRNIHNLHRSLDILLVARKENGKFVSRKTMKEQLKAHSSQIQNLLNLPIFSVMDSVCTTEDTCSNHGNCTDVIKINEQTPVPLTTQSNSFVSLKFKQMAGCSCNQGYDGVYCENLVNACGHRPCLEYEECVPSATLSRGYSCRCPNGKAGPRCHVDLTECEGPSCHYPVRPLSFKGKSYAQYDLRRPLESSSMQLSLYIRTRQPAGIIFYASGEVDYSILEISGGHVQYRWDCGSGEGLVKVGHLRVDDDKWHFINITRDGTVSKLSVDKSVSSGASPGVHDILNMDSETIYVGAKVETYSGAIGTSSSLVEYGFVGCLDLLTMNDYSLPVDVSSHSPSGKISLKRLANVELRCPESLAAPGICGSHPCLNGGTCKELSEKYSCSCSPQFIGTHCEIDTAPCSSSPCLNGGKCKVVEHNYVCTCPLTLSGKRCEYGVFCTPNPCRNGGRCEEGVQGPICKCQHFTGVHCEMDIDECTQSPCRNGGTCVNVYGGFRCLCLSNVTGEYCTEAHQKQDPESNFFLSFKELVCVLAILLASIIIILMIAAWQRKRWRYKRHQQNNRVKLTGHHVKNDLKTSDVLKRNSKICNVEADQLQLQGPLLPRPSSYTPSGTADSVLLHTLKQLADISVSEQDALELSTLTRRRSHEYNIHNITKPSAIVAPMTSSPPLATSPSAEVQLKMKPWDHHNNLNETYFTPLKDVLFDLPPNLEELPRGESSQALNSSFSDNSSVPSQHKERVYQWDDYDVRGSSSMLTFGQPSSGAGNKELYRSSSSRICERTSEGDPLLQGDIALPAPITTSTPLLTPTEEQEEPRKSPPDGKEAEEYNFEDILFQNNISSDHSLCPIPPPPSMCFNIEKEEKISNIPASISPNLSLISSSESYLDVSLDDTERKRLGSPRSRRPFVRSDFGRVSDVSFLSTLDEERPVSESYL